MLEGRVHSGEDAQGDAGVRSRRLHLQESSVWKLRAEGKEVPAGEEHGGKYAQRDAGVQEVGRRMQTGAVRQGGRRGA